MNQRSVHDEVADFIIEPDGSRVDAADFQQAVEFVAPAGKPWNQCGMICYSKSERSTRRSFLRFRRLRPLWLPVLCTTAMRISAFWSVQGSRNQRTRLADSIHRLYFRAGFRR